ncbi:hypothetical protein II654_01785 [bacterium]|nr:hypothetical protein [bacterium]
MKNIQTIVNDVEYQKLFIICQKMNITIYDLMKKYVLDFIKKNELLIPKKRLEELNNG